MRKSNSIQKILNNSHESIDDLERMCHELKLRVQFIGSMWNLPKKMKNGNYIILMHNPESSSGHWVSLRLDTGKAYFSDSYGQPPACRIVDSIGNRKIYYNNKQIQAMNHGHCGLYAIWWLMHGADGLKCFYEY